MEISGTDRVEGSGAGVAVEAGRSQTEREHVVAVTREELAEGGVMEVAMREGGLSLPVGIGSVKTWLGPGPECPHPAVPPLEDGRGPAGAPLLPP